MAEEDLIFGKKRHLFGGIEPSNMVEFSSLISSGRVLIKATLPNDTEVNNQVLCSVEGAVIRRKTSGYPINEFDGDLVADIKQSTMFVDSEANKNHTYYYAAFPYTTQGVYNRNKTNRTIINEPKPMQRFSSSYIYNRSTDTIRISIEATLPEGATGAIIRKSTIGYPMNENEGTLFKTITSSGTYIDNSVEEDITYYYSAFPYRNSGGPYSINIKNQSSITPKKRGYLFGYDLVKNTPNPDTRVTYPSDVDNARFTPAFMNFNTKLFNYGGWDIQPGEKFMPRPCMLTYEGVVDHYLNPNDYTKKIDGGKSSIADKSFNGNAMIEWSKIYTKRWESNGVYHFRCSDIPLGDGWECWCNYDQDDNQVEHFYTPIYDGSKVDNRLRSISGVKCSTNTKITDDISTAEANGKGWHIETIADRFLIQDLLVMMSKSTDLQRKFGWGYASTLTINSGTMNTKGMFWGDQETEKAVKVFGMENWWGNIGRRIAGWLFVDGMHKIKITRGTHDGTSVRDYNVYGLGYLTIQEYRVTESRYGYISLMRTESFGRIPTYAGGSSSTYETDYYNAMAYEHIYHAHTHIPEKYEQHLYGPFSVDLSHKNDNKNILIGAALSYKLTN